MGAGHGDARGVMAENFLHFVKGVPRIDEETGKGVAQVVQAQAAESQPVPDGVPGIEERTPGPE